MKLFLQAVLRHPFVTQRPMLRQFIKFGIVGVINTVLDYILFATFFYFFDVHYLWANAMSFSIAVTNSYVLNRRWTFRSDNPQWKTEAAKFLIINIIGLGLSEIILFIFVDRLHVHQLLAKAGAIAVVLFWNFTGTRLWAFKQNVATSPVN